MRIGMSDHSQTPPKALRTPRSLDLAVTGRGRPRCEHCCHFDSPADVGADLTTKEWLNFFVELNSLGVLEITIGGEPLIREDFRDLIEGVVENRMRFSLVANGTLLTDEIAEFLANTGRCNVVQVSVDGPVSRIHDKTCAQGSFKRVMRGLEHLERRGVDRTVRVTITQNNVDHLEEAARVLFEEVGLPSLRFQSVRPFGMTKENAARFMLTPDQFARAMSAHHRIIQEYGPRVNAKGGPLSAFTRWNEMESLKKENAPPVPREERLIRCGGVFNKMAVRADGVMAPCTRLPHRELGRINRDSLLEVWRRHSELQRLRERSRTPLSDLGYCRACDYRPYCRGGCPANAHELTDVENNPTPSDDFCYRRFKDAGGVLPVFSTEVGGIATELSTD